LDRKAKNFEADSGGGLKNAKYIGKRLRLNPFIILFIIADFFGKNYTKQ